MITQTPEHNIVAERGIIDKNNISNSKIILGIYTRSNNQKVDERQEIPNAVVKVSDGVFTTNSFNDNTLNFNMLLQQTESNFRSMIVLSELTESLFTKLFYLDGETSKSFEKFHDVRDLTGSRIITWKVNWEDEV